MLLSLQKQNRITKDAAAPITGEQIQEAMSPYQQAVVDIEKREAQKAFEQNVLPKVRAAQVAQVLLVELEVHY